MRPTSTLGTRSPCQEADIISSGWAQTLKLYGIMKCLAMPAPKTELIQF